MAEPLATLLSETDVLKVTGETVRLGTFFEHAPAALLFVRHFG